ncbi:aspartyl protease family protein [Acetobacter nitrogenifigens]|uniref:Aspartyl protease n=1 Tax=Acetobacter nitrogenifigens DSM 23921 = NBRC 105050 TaxID=1120919 RepID=A0A511X6X2_9PROT|nr:aspartyl protease family protein [Acetobacter nitrogenifigens]GEN58698.1 hypothetical protein ANI02nite_05820 [Acetobacter nitrogenifigens DSM 23921 = NBRC 105050]
MKFGKSLGASAFCVALSLLGGAAQAQQVIQLVTTGGSIEAARASVNKQEGLFLFDSGIGTSGVTPSVATRIGCRPWGKVTGFRAIGERVDFPKCNTSQVSVGFLNVTMPQLSVIDLEKLMGPDGKSLSGVLGLDIFANRVVTLDVARNRIVLENPQTLEHIKKIAHEMPIRLVRSAEGAALTADLGVPTSAGTLWMEIDTGNYGPSLIDQNAASLVGLNPRQTANQDWRMTLPNALTISGPAIVKDLILDGDFGRDALRHWVITLDLANSRGWLRTSGK